jgi:hypothetical protein
VLFRLNRLMLAGTRIVEGLRDKVPHAIECERQAIPTFWFQFGQSQFGP